MRARFLVAAVPLMMLAACSRPAADPPDPADPPDLAPSDLMMGSGFDAATPVASDLELSRAEAEPPPAPAPRRRASAASAAPQPAAPEAGTDDVPHAVHAEAEPDAAEPAMGDGATTATDADISSGGGKPRPSLNEGPIRDPRSRGVLVRGGAAGVDDDCALHPNGHPRTLEPPIVAAQPALDRGVLINDRAPPGGSIDGARALPNPMGAGHPGGTGTSMTGRPLPDGGRMTAAPMRGGGGSLRRGGIR